MKAEEWADVQRREEIVRRAINETEAAIEKELESDDPAWGRKATEQALNKVRDQSKRLGRAAINVHHRQQAVRQALEQHQNADEAHGYGSTQERLADRMVGDAAEALDVAQRALLTIIVEIENDPQ